MATVDDLGGGVALDVDDGTWEHSGGSGDGESRKKRVIDCVIDGLGVSGVGRNADGNDVQFPVQLTDVGKLENGKCGIMEEKAEVGSADPTENDGSAGRGRFERK